MEMRELKRHSIAVEEIKIPVGKRKAGQPQRFKSILRWLELEAMIDEALSPQRDRVSMYSATPPVRFTHAAGGTRVGPS
jgi:hypothetical protein